MWASGSLAARCGAPASQTRHSWSVWAGFLPLSRNHRASGAGPGENKNFSRSLRRISAAAHSIAAFGDPGPDPAPAPPNGSPLRPRGRAAPRRVFERLLCANKQRAGGEKQQPWRLAKWSSTLSPRSICAAAPRPPSPPVSPLALPPRCTLAGGLSLVGHMLRPLREWAGVGREGDVLEKLKVMW